LFDKSRSKSKGDKTGPVVWTCHKKEADKGPVGKGKKQKERGREKNAGRTDGKKQAVFDKHDPER